MPLCKGNGRFYERSGAFRSAEQAQAKKQGTQKMRLDNDTF